MSTERLAGTLTSFSVTLETIVCVACGIPFAVPKNYKQALVESHERFFCPNGHGQSYYGETEEEKLKKQLLKTQNELAQTATAKIQLQNQLEKVKKDISHGKCPCCDKTYVHLAKHMATKHPKYK